MNIELIKQILEDDTIENFKILDRIIKYDRYDLDVIVKDCQINIYEFAHKCKIWALKNGFYIESKLMEFEARARLYNSSPYSDLVKWKDDKTEPKAILKACEYIFKEKKD